MNDSGTRVRHTVIAPSVRHARGAGPGARWVASVACHVLLVGVWSVASGAAAQDLDVERGRGIRQRGASLDATTLDELHVRGEGDGRAARGLPPVSGVVGQPPPPYAGGQVATGTRVGFLGNRSVLRTPFNVTGYTNQLNRDQVALTVGDVIQNDPSVRIDSPPFSERDSYFIRGFSVTNLDTAFDGLFYIANPRRSQLEGIERVEILKGPTALLGGGTGRVGGTINLVPKRAFDVPLTRVDTFFIIDSQFGSHVDMGANPWWRASSSRTCSTSPTG